MFHAIVLTGATTGASIISAVSTVGFPIVMCGLLFWYIQSKMDKMTEVIAANTAAMNKLAERLDKE
jgi:hypothetical protein